MPAGDGGRRRWTRLAMALSCGVLAASAGTACSRVIDDRTVGVYTLAMTDKTAAAVEAVGDEPPLYQVTTQVRFPLRETPTTTGAAVKPYARPVWFTSSELQPQLTYVITNMTTTDVVVELLVDGWNEFIRYKPTVAVVDDGGEPALEADRSMVDRLIIVPALARVEGRVSFDDFERMATALAILNWDRAGKPHPNPFHVVEPHTRLQTDPATASWIPPVIDGLTGFDLSLRARGKVKVVLEAALDLTDHLENGAHLVAKGEEAPRRRPPADYVPVVAPPPP